MTSTDAPLGSPSLPVPPAASASPAPAETTGGQSRGKGDSEPKTTSTRKGVFDPRRVRFVSFVVIALGLFTTATFCVLAIWDYATTDTAWRAVATLGVVAGTMFIFTAINEMFGKRIEG
jgi:hypothetical protein